MHKKKMVVIGGGAAGMMTAIMAADSYEVTLLEKNDKLGKKLFITGKGRCNLTNDCDNDTFLKNVVTNSKFLYSAISSFTTEDVKNFFESNGLRIKTERGNRVFPASDHSSDVIAVLDRALREKGVRVLLGTKVLGIETADNSTDDFNKKEECVRVSAVRTARGSFDADVVVVATGGVSYPTTGSSGDGYRMSEELGHTIVKPEPSLVPVCIEGKYCKELMGLSLKNIDAKFVTYKDESRKKEKVIYDSFGEMIFTHFGVSGPVILSASSYLHKAMEKKQDIYLKLDYKPALSKEQLNERLLRDFEKNNNKQFRNSLDELLPKKLIPIVVEMSGIDQYKQVNLVTHEERMRLIEILKGMTFKVSGLRDFDEAIITKGGIPVKEINPKTMESKLVKGLRFAGEVIDCDALTGGFNLQIAWSTAFLAAGAEL